jgi:hypothetical protein
MESSTFWLPGGGFCATLGVCGDKSATLSEYLTNSQGTISQTANSSMVPCARRVSPVISLEKLFVCDKNQPVRYQNNGSDICCLVGCKIYSSI